MISFVLRIVAIYRRFRRLYSRDTRFLILAPSSPGSLGDEAVITALVAQLGKLGVKVTIIGYLQVNEWFHIDGVDRGIVLRDYFDYGSRRDQLRFVWELTRQDRFVVVGTDVLDGKYSEKESLHRIGLMKLAAQVGVIVETTGVSFNAAPNSACVTALRQLNGHVRLRARDKVSQQRFELQLGLSVELTADVAFLLKSNESTEKVRDTICWIQSRQSSGRIVLGVNLNHLLLRLIEGLDVDRLIDVYYSALQPLLANGITSILLLPHDTRGEISDLVLCDLLRDRLVKDFPNEVSMIPFPLKAAEIKGIVGNLDVVLAGKMHLAIACLGRTIPVGCITYQDKFEGLMLHFELKGNLISPNVAFEPRMLERFVSKLVDQRNPMREQIKKRLPAVLSLAKKNFSDCVISRPILD